MASQMVDKMANKAANKVVDGAANKVADWAANKVVDGVVNKIDIVVTMAGLGSRFRKAGYDVPKYMIQAKGRSLFAWSMASLAGFTEKAEQYIFVCMEDREEDVQGFIRSECRKLGIVNYQIILIDYLTDGQASTAMLASKHWKKENGLLIYNIDTYVEAGEMNSGQIKGDGFIPCFQADGDHWSFVRTDGTGRALEIREKQRISGHCTLGAYYFKSCGLYEGLYQGYYSGEGNLVNGEKYVAPLYNYLLENGGDIYITDIPPERVHVLGTPEELQDFLGEGPGENER